MRHISNDDTGDVARTLLNEQITAFYNVETYGAVHDGVTDDTEAIQDAINACFDAGGGTVFFPNGIYIIAGGLQNDVGDDNIDYNSQLYIPNTKLEAGMSMISIKLLGESFARNIASGLEKTWAGVVLKSTIAGTGIWPSVLCSMGTMGAYGRINYTIPIVENISIIVEAFKDTTGASMSGINFLYASHSIIENVCATIDIDNIKDSIEPANHSFGIAVGCPQNDHPIIYSCWVSGFYYNLVLGEGTKILNAELFWGYIGIHLTQSGVGLEFSWMNILGCKYPIASQQEDMYEIEAGGIHIVVSYMIIEQDADGDRCPDWTRHTDNILDASNRIKGFMNYEISDGASSQVILGRSNGGTSLMVRSASRPSGYHWTTANRSYSAKFYGIPGYNLTTGRMEYFTSAAWKVISHD